MGFPRDAIEKFLRAVDRSLKEPVTILVIGGTAATLRYGATRATQDIDTVTAVSKALAVAASEARAKTGFHIPIQRVTIADEPEDYESRLERVLPRLKRLRVLVPERHDLVLMKAMRAYEHDLQVIGEIHAHAPPVARKEPLEQPRDAPLGSSATSRGPQTLRLQTKLGESSTSGCGLWRRLGQFGGAGWSRRDEAVTPPPLTRPGSRPLPTPHQNPRIDPHANSRPDMKTRRGAKILSTRPQGTITAELQP